MLPLSATVPTGSAGLRPGPRVRWGDSTGQPCPFPPAPCRPRPVPASIQLDTWAGSPAASPHKVAGAHPSTTSEVDLQANAQENLPSAMWLEAAHPPSEAERCFKTQLFRTSILQLLFGNRCQKLILVLSEIDFIFISELLLVSPSATATSSHSTNTWNTKGHRHKLHLALTPWTDQSKLTGCLLTLTLVSIHFCNYLTEGADS